MPTPPVSGSPPAFEAPARWRAIELMSDLHLGPDTPRGFDAWATHLRHTDADAVFILGDLFEVWIGDDTAERGFEAGCVEVLREASRRMTVAFMPGNRDFLVGDAMLASAGVARLADPTVVTAFGARVVLSHGDALVTDEVAYQRYRAVVRQPFAQKAFAALPLSMRSSIGAAMRRRSGRREPRPQGGYADVDGASTLALLRRARSTVLIHGHTHAPAMHVLAPDATRHVLSDWELDCSSAPRAEVLRWTAAGFERLAPVGEALARHVERT